MNNINIYCVLKYPNLNESKKNIYTLEYVNKLYTGITSNSNKNTNINFVCLSNDNKCNTKLIYDWPGWWSKMELFRPDIQEDILYMDLDTIIYSDLSPIYDMCANNPFPIMIAPFHTEVGSGVMWLPKKYRQIVWKKWISNPNYWINKYKKSGDQGFIYDIYKPIVLLFQDIIPGCIVSFKEHCKNYVPDNAIIICYHGKPKPHETNWSYTHN